MELTIKGTPEEIKKALQTISGSQEQLKDFNEQKLNALLKKSVN